jgi:hypothetical protein
MVHGDCSSRGCYAMTDEQIAEIYSMGRESFFGGQRAFQFQAYPFRMTPLNMAKHRNNPNMPFWKMIKQGYDHFEVTRLEPKVDFCEKKYVFDAVKAPNATRDPVFEASAKCPAYVIPDEITDAVREKQQDDDAETAKLIAKGVPVARIGTGIDGGMHKIFAAKLANGSTGLSEGNEAGQGLSLAFSRAPGTIPPHVNPPRASASEEPGIALSSPASTAQVATTASDTQTDGFFGNLARKIGLGSAAADTAADVQPAPAKSKVAEAKMAEAKRSDAPKAAVPPKAPDAKLAAGAAPQKPSASDSPAAAPAAKDDVVAGAQPIVSSNSFESRFSAIK